MGLGYVEGVTHDYIRHGTTTLFAALDVATGAVIAECKPRHRQPLCGRLRLQAGPLQSAGFADRARYGPEEWASSPQALPGAGCPLRFSRSPRA